MHKKVKQLSKLHLRELIEKMGKQHSAHENQTNLSIFLVLFLPNKHSIPCLTRKNSSMYNYQKNLKRKKKIIRINKALKELKSTGTVLLAKILLNNYFLNELSFGYEVDLLVSRITISKTRIFDT